MVIDGLFEGVTARGGAAIVEGKDDVALLCHHLVPEESSWASPGIRDHLGVWPAVGEGDDGIFLRRVELWRLDHRAMQGDAVAGLHGEKFDGRKTVLREFRDLVLF